MKSILTVLFLLVSGFSLSQIQANEGDRDIPKVFECLDKAYNAAQSIKNPEQRAAVCNFFQFYQKKLKDDYTAKDYTKLKEDAEFLHENLDEILAECSDYQAREKIMQCVNDMIEQLNMT